MKAFLLLGLLFGLAGPSQAQLAPRKNEVSAASPLEKQLRGLTLPKVEFREANLAGALEYLKRKAAQQSGGLIDAAYVLEVSEEVALSYSVTLSLNDIPFLEALRYVGELAGVKFAIGNGKIVAKATDDSLAGAPTVFTQVANTKVALVPTRGLEGRLGAPAEPVNTGGHVHRNTANQIQWSKSGYLKHRSAGGWSVAIDPNNTIDVNCSERIGCPAARHSPSCLSGKRPDPRQPATARALPGEGTATIPRR